MGLLCGPIIMFYIWKDEIYIIYPTENVFAYFAATKHHFLWLYNFKAVLGVNWQEPEILNFEINCHMLLCDLIIMNDMWKDEICTIYHTENAFGLHCRDKTWLFRNLRLFWEYKWQDPATSAFKINSHGAFCVVPL